jgi:hypothetical protein
MRPVPLVQEEQEAAQGGIQFRGKAWLHPPRMPGEAIQALYFVHGSHLSFIFSILMNIKLHGKQIDFKMSRMNIDGIPASRIKTLTNASKSNMMSAL